MKSPARVVKWLAVVACGQAISDLTFFSNRLAFCVSPLLRVFVWSNTDLERYSSTANHYDYRWGKTRVRRMDYEIPYCERECEWILVLPIAPLPAGERGPPQQPPVDKQYAFVFCSSPITIGAPCCTILAAGGCGHRHRQERRKQSSKISWNVWRCCADIHASVARTGAS